jgi:hypothetical protein
VSIAVLYIFNFLSMRNYISLKLRAPEASYNLHPLFTCNAGTFATPSGTGYQHRRGRRPRLLLRLSGLFLLRFDARAFLALLFQLPPRLTRLEPEDGPSGQNPKTRYDISTKPIAVGKASEFQQRFHMPDQFLRRPFAPAPQALVQPEFVDEAPLATRRKKDLLWKHTIAEERNPLVAAVHLKIRLHLKGQAIPQEFLHRWQFLP